MVPSPEDHRVGLEHLSRLGGTVLVVAVVALVFVPSAWALRFSDESRLVPDGAVGSRYFHQFEGVGGCGPALPYQFRILGGSLPPGLTLSSGGLVSGTPTQGGRWSFWVELSDQRPATADWCIPRQSEEEFTINIGARGTVPDAPSPDDSGGGGLPLPSPCVLPMVATVCVAAGVVGKVAAEAGEFVMRGVTAWVTNAAVWVTGKVGELIERTTGPDLGATWFEGQYGTMVAVAGALAILMLLLAVIQSVIRQDVGMLARAAFGYLPMAFILSGVAIAGASLLVAITDDMSAAVVSSLGTEQSDNLLQAVGDAYKNALEEDSGIPLFGVFLGAIILALGAFVLWLEMIIRDAAIYICVFFLPLTFVAMIWPATGRWARRLVELLVAIILAKFVIVSILALATAAITNTGVVEGEGRTFEQMLAGSALLVLAAWSPFALLRMIPAMEVAAASVVHQRSAADSAAGSVGMHSPSHYMKQHMQARALQRRSRASTSSASGGTPGVVYLGGPATGQSGGGSTGEVESTSRSEFVNRPPYASATPSSSAPPGASADDRADRGPSHSSPPRPTDRGSRSRPPESPSATPPPASTPQPPPTPPPTSPGRPRPLDTPRDPRPPRDRDES
jgi:hypothetical protein